VLRSVLFLCLFFVKRALLSITSKWLLKNKESVKEGKTQGPRGSLRKPGERSFEVVSYPESCTEVGFRRSLQSRMLRWVVVGPHLRVSWVFVCGC
jgi:hypothetical protein